MGLVVSYFNMCRVLSDLECFDREPASRLVNVLFNQCLLLSPMPLSAADVTFFNDNLDPSQKEAVAFALASQDIAVIHGPPGTGKTTVLVEIITQLVRKGKKVLACAPSNVAVDNLVERLGRNIKKMIRLGHPARVNDAVKGFSLDACLRVCDQGELVMDIRKEMDAIVTERSGRKGGLFSKGSMLRSLKKELREREKRALAEVLKGASVVLATLTGAVKKGPLKHVNEEGFDVVVIDEAAQALEVACWIPLLQGKRCILAGDHHQLPPTILSQEALKNGLGLTLMERAIDELGEDRIVRMLTTQYRMNVKIMNWPSHQLYKGLLTAAPSVEHHLLKDLPEVEEVSETATPLLYVDTAGCNCYENESAVEISKGNEDEADIIAEHVKNLIEAGVKGTSVAVITPYSRQVGFLRRRLAVAYPGVEIRSVDGFQGREKEAVCISLVRSNDKGDVGFLKDDRRINVAITRARRHLCVVGDSQTVGRHPFLKSLLDYMVAEGNVWSAEHYIRIPVSLPEDRTESVVETLGLALDVPVKSASAKGTYSRHVEPKCAEPSSQKNASACCDESSVDEKKGEVGFTSHEEVKSNKEDIRRRIESEIDDFLDESMSELRFPSRLSSYERLIVHEISEARGLRHISQGEGNSRCVVVSCLKTKVAKPENDTEDDDDDCRSADIAGRRQRRKVAKRKSTVSAKKKESSPDRNPEDAHLLLSTKPSSQCFLHQCKESITLFGQLCRHCNRTFCLSHRVPESHGCGSAARLAEARTSKTSSSLGKGCLENRDGLQKKLSSKLHDMKTKRNLGGKHKRK
eukprot:m.238719 g.238719  ORF g.238719 m.238719 type:complete len:805 (+) comp40170_c0_seq19:883-3297(+)